jgi:hypothetical protein
MRSGWSAVEESKTALRTVFRTDLFLRADFAIIYDALAHCLNERSVCMFDSGLLPFIGRFSFLVNSNAA